MGRTVMAPRTRLKGAVPDAHKWEFKARFRRHAFGWRSQPAIRRVRQAVAEIKKAALKDPVLAADGAVTLLERLTTRLRAAKDAELEGLSHYFTEPAAKRLAKPHPDVAARICRALGMRILKERKSRSYDTALSNFEDAKRCYERTGLNGAWDAVVAVGRCRRRSAERAPP
jgi:hypothetical protein